MKKAKKQHDDKIKELKAKDSKIKAVKVKDKKPKDKDVKVKEKAKEKDNVLSIALPAELEFSDEIKRLNRVTGQIEGIKKMLEDKRSLNDVLIQSKAVHSALKSVEQRILNVYLTHALAEIVSLDKKKTRAEQIASLQELYKHAG